MRLKCIRTLLFQDAKYSHAAVWPLVPGFDKKDANGKTTRNYPVAAMVANVRSIPLLKVIVELMKFAAGQANA